MASTTEVGGHGNSRKTETESFPVKHSPHDLNYDKETGEWYCCKCNKRGVSSEQVYRLSCTEPPARHRPRRRKTQL